MKRNTAFFMLFVFTCGAFAEDSLFRGVGQERLTNYYFDSIQVVETNLLIKFKSSGEKCLYRVNNGELSRAAVGQTLVLSLTSTVTVIKNRDMNVTLSPFPASFQARGFDIKESINLRSAGAGLNTSRVFMVISSEVEPNKEGQSRRLLFVEPSLTAIQKALQQEREAK